MDHQIDYTYDTRGFEEFVVLVWSIVKISLFALSFCFVVIRGNWSGESALLFLEFSRLGVDGGDTRVRKADAFLGILFLELMTPGDM